jgi:hypothetical protein
VTVEKTQSRNVDAFTRFRFPEYEKQDFGGGGSVYLPVYLCM